ncbi:MAG: hypothetical protein M3014_03650, partial [Chloroflexota bacterium]|nr:hypothetical protein [Chloroflexota bacterium]
VGVSLAGTLIGWALFSRQDALVAASRESEAAIAALTTASPGAPGGASASVTAQVAAGFAAPAGYALSVTAGQQASTTPTAYAVLSTR